MFGLPHFDLPKFGDGIGLHRIERFFQAQRIDRASLARRSIVVTGTNGKGSTARFLTSAIGSTGFKVGCFTSPHLFDVRERFTLGDQMIPKEEFEHHASTVADFNAAQPEGDRIGSFEFLFLLAVLWFQQKKPDAIVWEAGIGGRYDPVRAVCALVSTLTSIELEHTDILGSTEELIAYDKVDALAPGGTVVLSPSINAKLATRVGAYGRLSGKVAVPAMQGRRIGAITNDTRGAHFTYGLAGEPACDIAVELKLAGRHQVENAVTAVRAAETWFGSRPSESSPHLPEMLKALSTTRWPGRLERVAQSPDLWIDVGHTPQAIDCVTSTFQEFVPRESTLVVFGVSASKEVNAIAEVAASRFDRFIVTRANKSGADPAIFVDIFRSRAADVTVEPDISRAAKLARDRAAKDNLAVLAIGGLFLAVETQHAWKGGNPKTLEFL
jgi:dihydrofolate synthase / folylpolyglutamate synthase